MACLKRIVGFRSPRCLQGLFVSRPMSTISSDSLVTPEWLAENIGNVKVVDGSWHMPNTGQDALKNFTNQRIPTARFFDIDIIKNTTVDLPHMFPSPDSFAEQVGAMGISEQDQIVVYDQLGLFSAARVWHTFRAFGAKRVSILHGGLPLWTHMGLPTDSGEPSAVTSVIYNGGYQEARVRNMEDIRVNIKEQHSVVVDARSAGRFDGTAPEPRAELLSGHMPQAVNVPFTELIEMDRDSGASVLKSDSALKQAFEDAGVDLTSPKPIIASCGSGVTASILAFALEARLGKSAVSVYDGSWTEYASAPGNQICSTIITS